MKRFGTMLLVTALALPAFAAEKIVGRWEAPVRSKGGIGQTFEFRENGELLVTPGAMVDAKYVRDGSKVTTTMPDGSGAQFEIEVAGDQLARKANNVAVKMARVGKAATGSDLVGVWTYEYNLGGPAYEIFTSEGGYHFRYPFSKNVQKGNYAVNGEILQMTMADGRKLSLKPSFPDEKTMVLTDELGKGEKYVRALY